MTREIKFRQWAIFAGKERMQEVWPVGKNEVGKFLVLWNGSIFTFDQAPMQFTGLFDKNKREIYESDIVKGPNDAWTDPPKTKKREHKIIEWKRSDRWNGWNIAKGESYEIIGNIYENPNLLK